MADRRLNEDFLELLFDRLTWPSPMVRERAATGLAGLILGSDQSAVRSALLAWLSRQQLENVSALGLLALCRARDLDSRLDIRRDELIAAISRPSLLSHLLLIHLKVVDRAEPLPLFPHSGTAPSEFEPHPFFDKYVRSYVAPLFAHQVEDIQRRSGIPLMRQWAFEWEKLRRDTGTSLSDRALIQFRGRENQWYFPILDLPLSDLYNSALLRVVAWGTSVGGLPQQIALMLAAEICPIDLGLWLVTPQPRPERWPNAAPSVGEIDTVGAEIWAQVRALWDAQCADESDERILAAAGRVSEGRTVYDLEILGVFYAANGPQICSPKDVFNWCGSHVLPTQAGLICLEGVLEPQEPSDVAKGFGDLSFVPGAGYVGFHSVHAWQSWRRQRVLRLPAPYLGTGTVTFRSTDRTVEAHDERGCLSRWQDWTNGVTEMALANLTPPTGSLLTVRTDALRHFERETRSRFAWICRLTGYQRRQRHIAFEEFHHHMSFGLSNLVLPR